MSDDNNNLQFNPQAMNLLSMLGKISQDPTKIKRLQEILDEASKPKSSVEEVKDEEEIFLEKIHFIASKVDVVEVLMQMIAKLYLKHPVCEYFETESKGFRWKCVMKIPFGANYFFEGIGINNNKKMAKSKTLF